MESEPVPEVPAPERRPEPSTSLTKGNKLTGVIVLVGALVAVFSVFSSCPRGSATGEIRSHGAPHGDFVVRPVTCFSGGHWGFTGVWVVTETLTSGNRRGFKGGLKIVINDAGGWEAHVENPTICQGFKCEQRRVDERQCRVFDLRLTDRNAWLRRDGHARLDCAFAEGGTLTADLVFKGCAAVRSGGDDASL